LEPFAPTAPAAAVAAGPAGITAQDIDDFGFLLAQAGQQLVVLVGEIMQRVVEAN
jgi:hypothetical protein